MNEIIISTRDATKKYTVGNSVITALDRCNIEVFTGEQIAITGKSGAGKSTLLHLLSGLDIPTSGSIKISGKEISKMSAAQRAGFRLENVGYIFQSYNLIPELTVRENIQLPALLKNNSVDKKHFREIVERLDIANRLDHYPSELSGGQQQRGAIARAIINKPKILLCDEPTGNLDSQTGKDVMELLRDIAAQYKITMLIVTHDAEIADSMQKIIRVSDGEIL